MRAIPFTASQRSLRLFEDLAMRLGTADLLEWIEQKTACISRFGDVGAWVEITPELLKQQGVVSLRPTIGLPGVARLKALSPGIYGIEYSNFASAEDRRFWIAHELAHTFFIAPNSLGQPLSALEKRFESDEAIEWLCNRAAAALLVPRSKLERGILAESAVNSLHRIPELALRYRVPETLIARRWLHDIKATSLAVICVQNGRVRWDAIPRGIKPRQKSLKNRIIPSSMLLEQYQDGATVSVDIDGRWWRLASEVVDGSRATPMARLPISGLRKAYVARAAGKTIVAIDLTQV